MSIEEMVAVLQAAKDGKPIQVLNLKTAYPRWHGITSPSWEFTNFAYRVKPDAFEEFWSGRPPAGGSGDLQKNVAGFIVCKIPSELIWRAAIDSTKGEP